MVFVSARRELAPTALAARGEIRMDFRSGDEAQNARSAADRELAIRHHSAVRAGDVSLVASNQSTATRYLSVRCDDFHDDGEGVLFSMWVRMENHRDAKATL
jgi:hypothetical protein